MIKEKYVLREPLRYILKKILETIIVFLLGMILVKGNSSFAESIKKKIYNDSFSFVKLNNISKKYLGGLIPHATEVTKEVFNEIPTYQNIEELENGVKMVVGKDSSIKVLENGMIMYIDDNSITIEQIDGVKTTYNNISHKDLKLYDYLEKGEIIGLSNSNEVTIIFSKEGEKVDYHKYF